jgi:O-antigen/teichoic acid export membrane protein
MGLVQKDALRTTLISSIGLVLGYVNKGLLFLLIFSTEQIGVVNLIFSLGVLFAQFSNLGSLYSIWKFFPFFKNKDKAHHGFLAFMLFIVSVGALLVTALFLVFRSSIESIYIEKSPLFLQYYYWVIPLGLGYLMYLVFEVYLRALFKNIISVFALDIVLRLAVTLLLFLFWNGQISFDSFVAGHSLLFFLPPLILIGYLIRIKEFYIHPKHIQISKRFQKILFNYSGFNYINSLGGVLVNSLDVIMVAQYIGLRATGVYTTVIFLTSALQVPYKALIRVSAPLVAEYWKTRDMLKMKLLYTQVSSVSLVLGLGLFLIVWVNIDFLFSLLKPEFSDGIWVFFFLMMGRLLDMYFGLNGAIFNTSKKYRYDLIFTLNLIVIVYVLNLYLIPLYGIEGAAISTAIALIVYNLGRVIFVFFTYNLHPFKFQQVLVIGVGVICFYLIKITPELFEVTWLNAALTTALTILIYFGAILLFNLEPELRNYLRNGVRHVIKNLRN